MCLLTLPPCCFVLLIYVNCCLTLDRAWLPPPEDKDAPFPSLVAPPILDLETFTPLPGSPAIDAGVDLSAEFTTDFYGKPRPVGAGFDIGAVERQAP